MQQHDEMPVFGTVLPGVKYEPRPGAYAFLYDQKGRLAVIHTSYGYFLPGGGIEKGESEEQGLTRELMEEISFHILQMRFLFKASQFHWSEHYQRHFQKIGSFYSVTAEPTANPTTQAGHSLLWLPVAEAQKTLAQEFQRWALGRTLNP